MNPRHSDMFPVPLGRSAYKQAEDFSRHQVKSWKAEQVYRNTLAVLAVNFWLKCMCIETNLSASDSWDVVAQTLLDVADIEIPNIGKLECRAVFASAEFLQIPLEVQSNRIGYVAVWFNQSLREAGLLGFLKTAPTEEIPLSQLEPLDHLIGHLSQIRKSKLLNVQVNLGQWLQNSFETDWQSVQTLLGGNRNNLALALRGNSQVNDINIQRGKVIDLGLSLGSRSVTLLVAIVEKIESQLCILVQVHPFGEEDCVPPNLRLILILETGEILKEVRARSQDLFIQMNPILVKPGESFSIQLVLNEFSVSEKFTV